MGWFTLGDGDAAATTDATSAPVVPQAVQDYQQCRDLNPASSTPSALTEEDPCWRQLVALRRYQGRDPLGRDVYGRAGYLAPQYPAPLTTSANYAELERTGYAAGQAAAVTAQAPATAQPLVIVVQQRQQRLREQAAQTESMRQALETRATPASALPAASPRDWQIAAAALGIGLALGKLFGGKGK